MIKPDEFYPIQIEGWEREVLVNAKYDRVDLWKDVGQFVLKIYDDEVGLMTLFVDDETAQRVIEHVDNLKYDPGRPLHVPFDQNSVPYNSCSIWQFEQKDDI